MADLTLTRRSSGQGQHGTAQVDGPRVDALPQRRTGQTIRKRLIRLRGLRSQPIVAAMSDPPPITLATAPVVTVEPAGRSIAALRLAGDWTLAAALPDATAVVAEAARAGAIERLTRGCLGRGPLGFGSAGLPVPGGGGGYRPRGRAGCRRRAGGPAPPAVDRSGGAAADRRAQDARPPLLARVGQAVLRGWDAFLDAVSFIGEVMLALLALPARPGKFRTQDVARVFYAAGPAALPIVTLIGLLAGLHPGVLGGNELAAVRGADLRRQPGHDRHGAGDGAADGGRDHRRPHRRRVRRRARHDAGQPGNRRAAHARRSTRSSSWWCPGCWR